MSDSSKEEGALYSNGRTEEGRAVRPRFVVDNADGKR